MTTIIPSIAPAEDFTGHTQFLREIEGLSWPELLAKRSMVEQTVHWDHPDIPAMDCQQKVSIINQLLPVANFRDIEIPEGGLEILPWLKLIHCGKVRNTFAHPTNPERLIVVNTDRISTHDVVHNALVLWKGETLKSVSDYWVSYFANHPDTKHIPTQLALNTDGTSERLPINLQWKWLESRANVFRKLKPFPVEAIVRRFLYGSAFSGYEKVKKGHLSVKNKQTGEWELGEYVGEGLQKCSEFNETLFTPSTKWKVDVNINFDGMVYEIQKWLVDESICTTEEASEKAKQYAKQIREYSLALYNVANEHAKTKWLTIADTKFEFGLDEEGNIVLIDESCTPDSSRYWTTTSIIPWQEPEQFDKQAVRDWVAAEWKRLENEIKAQEWWEEIWKNMTKAERKPPITIPDHIVAIAQGKYNEIRDKFSNTCGRQITASAWGVTWILEYWQAV